MLFVEVTPLSKIPCDYERQRSSSDAVSGLGDWAYSDNPIDTLLVAAGGTCVTFRDELELLLLSPSKRDNLVQLAQKAVARL